MDDPHRVREGRHPSRAEGSGGADIAAALAKVVPRLVDKDGAERARWAADQAAQAASAKATAELERDLRESASRSAAEVLASAKNRLDALNASPLVQVFRGLARETGGQIILGGLGPTDEDSGMQWNFLVLDRRGICILEQVFDEYGREKLVRRRLDRGPYGSFILGSRYNPHLRYLNVDALERRLRAEAERVLAGTDGDAPFPPTWRLGLSEWAYKIHDRQRHGRFSGGLRSLRQALRRMDHAVLQPDLVVFRDDPPDGDAHRGEGGGNPHGQR